MPVYTVEFPTPRGCWSDLTRKFDVKATVINFAWVGYRRYIALVRIEGKDTCDFLKEIEKSWSTNKLSICYKSSSYALVEIDAVRILPVYQFAIAEVLVFTPIVITRGVVKAKIHSNSKAINFLMEYLRKVGYPFKISRDETNFNGLTKTQRRILKEAIRHGYYSYPRKITLTKLAEKLGISKSYLSETLQIIESKLLGEISMYLH